MTPFHATLFGVPFDAPPLTPDGPTAQHWLRQELAKPEYQAAKPTWFDRLAQQISDWFDSLGFHVGSGAGWIIAAVGIALLAALIIGAFAIFGLPRLRRRRAAPVVFDDDDPRGVPELRRDAATAAREGRYDAAVLDLFRAISRALAERTIVIVLPGTTAQEVAVLAAVALPEFAARLHEAALLFDGVRYLGRAADAEDYAALKSLDDGLRTARPRLDGLTVDAMNLDAASLDATSSTADPIGSGRVR
ncbi:DUF4129 domain-containing protein [Humibacter sp. RRB41]|uniref:DUF4129 domain-containing protein n=1 Tax=Humibacter sp. RRB41 TaxID=2919946 RepID=UPI001FA97448|nr:DUF4129 domain-containing protein [Humibacter sp. RRB41]